MKEPELHPNILPHRGHAVLCQSSVPRQPGHSARVNVPGRILVRAHISGTRHSKAYLGLRTTTLGSKGTKPLQGYIQRQDRLTNKQRPTFLAPPNQPQLQGLQGLSGILQKTLPSHKDFRNLLDSGTAPERMRLGVCIMTPSKERKEREIQLFCRI